MLAHSSRESEFCWEAADALVEFSNADDIHLTGHTLVWHQQTPDWVFPDADDNQASRDLLLKRIKHHIESVVGRYKRRVQSWDVVNEAIDEDGSMRDTKGISSSIAPGTITPAAETLVFHSREEALQHRVVATFAGAAHAALDAVIRERLLELLPRVLAALIAMMQELRIRPATPDRHNQSVGYQICGHARCH